MQCPPEMFRYNRVFIAPPWERVYEPDRGRKQDFKQALRTYEAMVTAYRNLAMN